MQLDANERMQMETVMMHEQSDRTANCPAELQTLEETCGEVVCDTSKLVIVLLTSTTVSHGTGRGYNESFYEARLAVQILQIPVFLLLPAAL